MVGSLTITTGLAVLLPPNNKLKQQPSLLSTHDSYSRCIFHRKRPSNVTVVSRLFGPSIFEASKLKVMFLGVDEKKHPASIPRTYTLTHSDITSHLTLAISQTINSSQLQGWYNKLQRDEVVAEWKKVKGEMCLHVHCHVSGGTHLLHHLCANLRYFIFSKELPLVLKAFVHGDGNLLSRYPELKEASVWVYFHSSSPELNKVECWGPLKDAAAPCASTNNEYHHNMTRAADDGIPDQPCQVDCSCCFPSLSSSPQDAYHRYKNQTDAD
uniref:Staygreen protein domain-containing protein n=1 Tax=Kalanchoe fedtschenkoi TaxID=63787 RepID=A0A7N0THW4_KALFE